MENPRQYGTSFVCLFFHVTTNLVIWIVTLYPHNIKLCPSVFVYFRFLKDPVEYLNIRSLFSVGYVRSGSL